MNIFYSNEHPITTERQYLSHAKKIESSAKPTYQKYRNYKELASINSSMTMLDFSTMYHWDLQIFNSQNQQLQ
jgi:hypothetical protein